jgi:hypothetical protein
MVDRRQRDRYNPSAKKQQSIAYIRRFTTAHSIDDDRFMALLAEVKRRNMSAMALSRIL